MTHTVRTLAHSDTGTGGPALVQLPGWCGGRDVFDPLLPHTATSRRSISVDLPGQGDSAAPDRDFDSTDVLAEVIALADQLGLEQLVPVALSHSGWFAIELRRALGPARVPGIVLLDWMPIGAPPGFLDALGALQNEHAWSDVRAQLFAMWTSGVEVQAVHDYVASMGEYGYDMWSRAGREIAQSFGTHDTPVAAIARLAEQQGADCPTLHLYAQPGDDGYLAAQQGFAAEHPWFQVYRLSATSHMPTFEVPAEIAAQIGEFVEPLGS
jgi:pimeloyl-ACP methyl ester carboxylesterase